MSKTSPKSLERIEQILQGLLKHLKKNPDQETFRIPLKEFSSWNKLLEDRDGLEIAFANINSETKAVHFEFERENTGRIMTASEGLVSTGREVVRIHVEDIDEAIDYLNNLKVDVAIKSEPIKSLVLVRSEHGRQLQVIVNGDYKNIIKATGNVWDKLLRIADGERLSVKQNKDVKDYFNSNIKCKLYARFGYEVTKVLEIENGVLVKGIPIDVKPIKALKRKLNAA